MSFLISISIQSIFNDLNMNFFILFYELEWNNWFQKLMRFLYRCCFYKFHLLRKTTKKDENITSLIQSFLLSSILLTQII